MKSIASVQRLKEIDNVISKIKSFPSLTKEAEAYFAQFLIVYICGVYEDLIENTVVEMIQKLKANNEIENFIRKTLDTSFRNPDMGKITELFSKFGNDKWLLEIKSILEINRSAFNSISTNKNALAHGSCLFTLTISDVEMYYNNSKYVIEKIDELLL